MARRKPTEFDADRKLVTSYLFKSRTLAIVRLLFALLTTAILIFCIVWQAVVLKNAQRFFSFFTNLSYFGICGYFWAAGYHTWVYSKARGGSGRTAGTYPLQRWPRGWGYLHVLLYTTVVTYPIIVSVVYWALLAPSEDSFSDFFEGFSNITKHIMNSAFGLFELLLTNAGTHPWLNLLWTIVILGGYIGIAYITFATQGFYPYSFLDPANGAKELVMYLGGITAAQIVVFLVTQGVIKIREVFVRRSRTQKHIDSASDDAEVLLGLRS